jgi:hypothetical protein
MGPERALQQIISYRPGLAAVLERYGAMSLGEYAHAVFHQGRESQLPAAARRVRKLLADVFAAHAGPLSALAGHEHIQEQVRQHLLETGVVNTGPHHGIFGHPYLAADMVLPILSARPWTGPLIVLADSSVPLDNMSYPPGIFLTEKRSEESLQGRRVPIRLRLSPSKNHVCMLAAKPFLGEDVTRALSSLARLRRDGLLSAGKTALLEHAVQQWGEASFIQEAPSYSGQVMLMNAWLFPLLFSEELRTRLPRLVYLDCARVCTQALRELLLREEDHFLPRMLLDGRLRRAFVETARSASVTGSTDLFFGLSAEGRRVPLRLSEDGGQLMDSKGELPPLHLERGRLLEELEGGRLYAGFGLSFALLASGGLECVGGFNQAIGYLPAFLDALRRWLEVHGFQEDAEQVAAGNPLRLATLGTVFCEREGSIERAGAFDIIMGRGTSLPMGLNQEDLERCRGLKVTDWTHLNLPDLYLMTVPGSERTPELQDALDLRALAATRGGLPVAFPG